MVSYPSADDRRGIETNGVDAMKKFNITGTCFPNKHYMVDLTSRVAQIKAMVDDGAYFCINRGRQYGKTTTLHALKSGLASDYEVYAISFKGLDNASYETERHLAYAMMRQFEFAALMRGNNVSRQVQEIVSEAVKANKAEKQIGLDDFSMAVSQMCMAAQKPLVMIIDEVDQASNYDSFIRMLGLLRKKFLIRDQMPTFQSVILAGVYDIKNLKLKIRPEAEHQYNSPWNIAANFDVEMAFNVSDVEGMLRGYENDHHTGMDIHSIAKDIIDYTSGYPFLVSRLCMILDEKKLPWDREGFLQAERLLLIENNTLFDDMIKNWMIFLIFRIYYKLYYIKEKHSPIIQTTKRLTLQKCLDIFFQIPKEKHRYPIVSLKRGYTIISVQKRNRRLSFPQASSIKINLSRMAVLIWNICSRGLRCILMIFTAKKTMHL